MERVKGSMWDAPRKLPRNGRMNNHFHDWSVCDVIRISRGDVICFKGIYLYCDSFTTNESGARVMRLTKPKNASDFQALQQWGKANPHLVTRLMTGQLI